MKNLFYCTKKNLYLITKNEDGTITISDSYSFNIVNSRIDVESPVIMTGEPLKYTKAYKGSNISVKIFNPLNKEVFDKTANILII